MKEEKGQSHAPYIKEVKHADLQNNTFDGVKADLFINTGTTGGKVFLVQVNSPEGKPTLIAVHL